jgi:hypothetical protein
MPGRRRQQQEVVSTIDCRLNRPAKSDPSPSLRDRLTVTVGEPLFRLFYQVEIRHRQLPLNPPRARSP